MKKADDLYGPMEWRLPEASAIYWATVGLEKSEKKELIALRRVIYQSLHMNVMRGRIVAVNPDGSYTFGPDLGKIAMAQAGGVLVFKSGGPVGRTIMYLAGIDEAKFRRPVVPGDQLRFEIEVLKRRPPFWKMQGKAYVDNEVACEAVVTAMVMEEKTETR